MKARTLDLIAEWEAKAAEDPDCYFRGDDWFNLTPEEQWTFDIDPDRFPRMMAAVEAYEAMVGVFWHGHRGFTDQEVEEAKAHFKFNPDHYRLEDFKKFAKEYAGLTYREAMAVFHKHEFWHARNGILVFPDEKPEAFAQRAEPRGIEQ
jgi:hypothetical protein